MDRDEALAFLHAHQHLPSGDEISQEVLVEFVLDEVARPFPREPIGAFLWSCALLGGATGTLSTLYFGRNINER